MTGTSIGRAIDYIVGIFGTGFTGKDPYGAPLTVPSLSTINPRVIIGDTRPTDSGDAYVIIGRENDETDSEISATAAYQVLGRQRISEAYELPGHILVLGDGPDMKPTRDACLALHDGVTKLIWADPTLGGVLEDGRISLVSRFALGQPDSPSGPWASAGGGVAASVSFALQVENSYVP